MSKVTPFPPSFPQCPPPDHPHDPIEYCPHPDPHDGFLDGHEGYRPERSVSDKYYMSAVCSLLRKINQKKTSMLI